MHYFSKGQIHKHLCRLGNLLVIWLENDNKDCLRVDEKQELSSL